MKKEIENDYSKYYYKPQKNQVRKRVGSKVSVACFVIALTLTVGFFSYAFANFLTIGKIVNINTNFIVEGRTFYAISLKTDTTLQDANESAKNFKSKGAAGYIYNSEIGQYKILSSAYSTKKDALTVKENLVQSDINAEIIELKFLPLNLKISLNSKSSEALKKGLNLFFLNYKNLYELSNKFDANKLDEMNVKKEINSMILDNESVIKNTAKIFSTSNNIAVLYSKIYLGQINKSLNELLNVENQLSSEIKNTYFKIIFQYLNLQDEIL